MAVLKSYLDPLAWSFKQAFRFESRHILKRKYPGRPVTYITIGYSLCVPIYCPYVLEARNLLYGQLACYGYFSRLGSNPSQLLRYDPCPCAQHQADLKYDLKQGRLELLPPHSDAGPVPRGAVLNRRVLMSVASQCHESIPLPRGSKCPIFKDAGPKNHKWYAFWNQKPQILGTWTLWVRFLDTGLRLEDLGCRC